MLDKHHKVKKDVQLHGEVVCGADNISKIGLEWDDLFARAHDVPVFLSRAWIETFISENRIKGVPLLFVVWDGPKAVALLPLSIKSFCGIRIAEPIGTMEASYLGLMLDPDYSDTIGVVAEIWKRERVAHAFYNKYLSSLDKTTNKFISELGYLGFRSHQGFSRACPWIHLDRAFEDYLQQTKSGKRRKKLRYQERQVLKSGDVEIIRFIGNEITPEVISRIAIIQQESWMKRRGAAVLGNHFHRKLSIEMAKGGLGHVWLITKDGDDVAFGFALIAHKKLDLKWIAFKLKYESSLSFGKTLTMCMIRDACHEGIESFNFGLGESEYKRFWSTENHYVARAVVGRGVWGNLIVLYFRVVWWLAEQKFLFLVYRRLYKLLKL